MIHGISLNAGAQRTLALSWLLLVHQLPAQPAYLRVKIWRRLQGIGAIAVKNAVRIARGTEVFNNLYEFFGKKRQ